MRVFNIRGWAGSRGLVPSSLNAIGSDSLWFFVGYIKHLQPTMSELFQNFRSMKICKVSSLLHDQFPAASLLVTGMLNVRMLRTRICKVVCHLQISPAAAGLAAGRVLLHVNTESH